MLKFILGIILILLSFSSLSNTQEIISRDSLVWMQQSYGWVEKYIPTNEVTFNDLCCPDLPPGYDTLCSCFLDSIYVLVHVDSTEIPEELADIFEMTRVSYSVWVGSFLYTDTGLKINTFKILCNGSLMTDSSFSAQITKQGMIVYIVSGIGEFAAFWEEE